MQLISTEQWRHRKWVSEGYRISFRWGGGQTGTTSVGRSHADACFCAWNANKGHTKCTSNIAHTWVQRWCFIPNQKARNRGKVGRGGGEGGCWDGRFLFNLLGKSIAAAVSPQNFSLSEKNSLLGTFGEPDKASLSGCTSQSVPKFTLNLLG